jgi:hypothetical protein
MACLRLTERCADILISVREEIHEAGDHVTQELRLPLQKLVEYGEMFLIRYAIVVTHRTMTQFIQNRTCPPAKTGP